MHTCSTTAPAYAYVTAALVLGCSCMEIPVLWCRCPKLFDEWTATDLQWDEPDQNACNAWLLIFGKEGYWERSRRVQERSGSRDAVPQNVVPYFAYNSTCECSMRQQSRPIFTIKPQGIQSWGYAKQQWAITGHSRDGSDLPDISATLNLWHGKYMYM